MRIAVVMMAIIFAMTLVTGVIAIYAINGKNQNMSDKLVRSIGELQLDLKKTNSDAASLVETDARLAKDTGGIRAELAKITLLEQAGAGNKQEIEKCWIELADQQNKLTALEALNSQQANQLEQKIKDVSDTQNKIKKSMIDSQDKIQKDFTAAQNKTRKEFSDVQAAQAQTQKDLSEIRTQITSLNDNIILLNEKLDDLKNTLTKIPGKK